MIAAPTRAQKPTYCGCGSFMRSPLEKCDSPSGGILTPADPPAA